MFNLFGKGRQAAILEECHVEFERAARMSWQYVSPRDVSTGSALLQRAAAASLNEDENVRRLGLLHRLWAALRDNVGPTLEDRLLAEAARHQLAEISAARELRRRRELELLREHGPRVMSRDSQDRPVYFRCAAEFRNKSGSLDLRGDGLTFTGEVVVEIAWSNVAHAAKTSHTFQGYEQTALALQEGKRRTPTKFTFAADPAEYACAVAVLLWEQSKQRSV
jgi:hypothetical protein